jgi:hypothetical protein
VCPDDQSKAAERAKREAALAELGRRLAAEHQQQEAEDGGMNLNRTGHNYGPYVPPTDGPRPAPPAKASPSDTKPDSH